MFYFLATIVSADESRPKPWMNSDSVRWGIIIFIVALLVFTIRRAFKSEVKITKEKLL